MSEWQYKECLVVYIDNVFQLNLLKIIIFYIN